MKCDKCIYLGMVLDHLKGYNGIKEWRHCKYPLPYHADGKAVPMGVEHNCKCFHKSHICKHINYVGTMTPEDMTYSLFEVYCKDCHNFVNLLTGEIINDKGLVRI
jgi:hypothetical protein